MVSANHNWSLSKSYGRQTKGQSYFKISNQIYLLFCPYVYKKKTQKPNVEEKKQKRNKSLLLRFSRET